MSITGAQTYYQIPQKLSTVHLWVKGAGLSQEPQVAQQKRGSHKNNVRWQEAEIHWALAGRMLGRQVLDTETLDTLEDFDAPMNRHQLSSGSGSHLAYHPFPPTPSHWLVVGETLVSMS